MKQRHSCPASFWKTMLILRQLYYGEGAGRSTDSKFRFSGRVDHAISTLCNEMMTRLSTAHSVCGIWGCNECREFHPASMPLISKDGLYGKYLPLLVWLRGKCHPRRSTHARFKVTHTQWLLSAMSLGTDDHLLTKRTPSQPKPEIIGDKHRTLNCNQRLDKNQVLGCFNLVEL